MGRDDWVRSPNWDAAARREFEERLERSRSWSRPQYLRIKAYALLTSEDRTLWPEGRQLLQRVINEYPENSMEVPWAHMRLGRAFRREGRFGDAAGHLRACIEAADRFGVDPPSDVPMLLVEVLIEDNRIDEAVSFWPNVLANDALPTLAQAMPSVAYQYHLTEAKLLSAVGDSDGARRAARAALAQADATRSNLRKHPDDGLVPSDDAGLPFLRRVAGPPEAT